MQRDEEYIPPQTLLHKVVLPTTFVGPRTLAIVNLLLGRSVAESPCSPGDGVADATSTNSMPRKGYATNPDVARCLEA